jgi:hypothetical protein
LAAGHTVSETEVVWAVLAGLPPLYSTIKAILMSSESELELDSVMAKLLGVGAG